MAETRGALVVQLREIGLSYSEIEKQTGIPPEVARVLRHQRINAERLNSERRAKRSDGSHARQQREYRERVLATSDRIDRQIAAQQG